MYIGIPRYALCMYIVVIIQRDIATQFCCLSLLGFFFRAIYFLSLPLRFKREEKKIMFTLISFRFKRALCRPPNGTYAGSVHAAAAFDRNGRTKSRRSGQGKKR